MGASRVWRHPRGNPAPSTRTDAVPKRGPLPRPTSVADVRLPHPPRWYWLARDEHQLPAPSRPSPLLPGTRLSLPWWRPWNAAPARDLLPHSAAAEPVWANARARALGTQRGELPHTSTVERSPTWSTRCSRTGRPETLRGPTGGAGDVGDGDRGGRCASATDRASWWCWEPDDVTTDTSLWPRSSSGPRRAGPALAAPAVAADAARPAPLGQLPPGLLPLRRPAGTGTTRCRSAAAGWPSWSVTPWGTGCPPPAR